MSFDNRPIGIFDSGIGGFSILKALMNKMPSERFVYLSDAAFSPYGEKELVFIQKRSICIFRYFLSSHNVKAVVIACNTATAAAIDLIRLSYPSVPVIGVEPAIKPAVKITNTGYIGVIGTRNTLTSQRFGALKKTLDLDASVKFIVQPCDGLAAAIENFYSRSNFTENLLLESLNPVLEISRFYLKSMGDFGSKSHQIDTLVLGCTHYIFALPCIRSIVGESVSIIENGIPVAERVFDVLKKCISVVNDSEAKVIICTTGDLGDIKLIANNMFSEVDKSYRYVNL